ncbi:hypothetical protein [Nocardia salmonicida]|uniref:hypothetical protein n=1 Tax=Nocardia salmonicida TaxID=53431 RepID=UPI001042145E|nr:hypothetical protein [Nocardia salmonicida]
MKVDGFPGVTPENRVLPLSYLRTTEFTVPERGQGFIHKGNGPTVPVMHMRAQDPVAAEPECSSIVIGPQPVMHIRALDTEPHRQPSSTEAEQSLRDMMQFAQIFGVRGMADFTFRPRSISPGVGRPLSR